MTDSTYPNDAHLAGLVQAAPAAADEHAERVVYVKYDESYNHYESMLPPEALGDAPDPAAEPNSLNRRYSGSVLFREPPSKSRSHKSSSANVFESLDLAPEDFRRLQVAAKIFLFDEDHPERMEVIRHKSSSGTAADIRLRLWKCAESFLSEHGNGDKFFGPGDAERPRTLIWPEHGETIIKNMLPLIRKLVTNERQRIYTYATRHRRQRPAQYQTTARLIREQNERTISQIDVAMPDTQTPEPANIAPIASEDTSRPVTGSETLSWEVAEPSSIVPNDDAIVATSPSQPRTAFKQTIVIYVNVVSNTGGARRRVIPRFELTPETAPSLATLMDQVSRRYRAATGNRVTRKDRRPVVQVWLADGLVTVLNDGEWMVALINAGVVDWMDSEVRVLVEM
ncbi:uncharacterized protein PV06_00976 [Exophiala oligosperma]|uniref:Uncharacterized protein n=2 Tax=Chaetothyriales TaxID=34395 RepID=A0A0D2CER6_9EURO|nr:uncharacterized protein PV06_00976 [Exophiala oligosperma]KAJ9633283.1 hypothetical protein H2204_007179 [Knufia peltigerae]KIW48382.1 hypothetical protein PV06_00976 [Exophiala oligosperma]